MDAPFAFRTCYRSKLVHDGEYITNEQMNDKRFSEMIGNIDADFYG